MGDGPFPSIRGIPFPTCLPTDRHRGSAASLVPEPFGQKTPRVKEWLRRKAKGASPDFLLKHTSSARELMVIGYRARSGPPVRGQRRRAESFNETKLVAAWQHPPTSISASTWRLRRFALSSEPRC